MKLQIKYFSRAFHTLYRMQWKENIYLLYLIAYLQLMLFHMTLHPPPQSIGWLGYKQVKLSILAKTDTMYHHYNRVYWYNLLLAQNYQVTITEKVFTLFMTKNAGSVIYCKLPRSKLNITTIFQTMHVQFFFWFFCFWRGEEGPKLNWQMQKLWITL